MAYAFASASSQYLTTASTPVTAAPCTIAAISRGFSTGAAQVICALTRDNTSVQVLRLSFDVSNNLAADAFESVQSRVSSIAATPGNTNYCVGAFASTTSRTAYLGGTAATTNTDSATPAGLNRIGIGARWSSSWGQFANGDIAEVGIWNVALTADEISSLARGFKPHRVRPQSLVFYSPLVRDLQDISNGGRTITNNGSATVANHPRVY